MDKPLKKHYEVAIRVVKYLKKAPGQGILFKSDNDFRLRAYCDVSWASCPITRRSTISFCIFLRD